jgi:hypothetical protein
MATNVFDKPKMLHELTDVATDQQTEGAILTLASTVTRPLGRASAVKAIDGAIGSPGSRLGQPPGQKNN